MSAHKDASVLSYENRIAENPHSMVFARLADSYRKRGDIQQAIEVCSKGLTNHPDSITGRIILGRCYLEQEKTDDAVNEFISVIEYDRRNQVAVKMLADSFARQGLKDKAGDLYAYLSLMDPSNSSIVNLTETFPGSGKTDIFDILGVSPQPPAIIVQQRTESGESFIPGDDSAFTRTMPLEAEELAVGDLSSAPENFEKTIKYDSEELKQAEELMVEVEQKTGIIPKNVDETITGEDIQERMTAMFDEDEVGSESPVAVQPPVVEPENIPVAGPVTLTTDTPAAGEMPEISGNDISSRIDQLFINTPAEEVPGTTDEYAQMFDSTTSENREIEVISVDIEEPAEEPVRKQDALVRPDLEPSDVSGEDIVSRMTEMFELPEDEKSLEAIEMQPLDAIDKTVIDDTAEITVPGNLKHETDNEVMNENNLLDDIDKTSGLPVLADIPEPAAIVQYDGISGDDIAQRLENIFDDNSNVMQPQAETADTLTIGKDSVKPFDIDKSSGNADQAMEDDISVKDETSSFDVKDDTIFEIEDEESAGNMEFKPEPVLRKTSSEDDKAPEPENLKDAGSLQTELIEMTDNNTPSEEKSEAPEMSGNDVLSRLDELFPVSSLVNDASLIPEGEKNGNEEVNEGFYSISGENARSDGSGETLPEKLDEADTGKSADIADSDENIFGEKEFLDPQQDTLLGKDVDLQAQSILSEPLDVEIEAPDMETVPANQKSEEQSFPENEQGQAYSIPDHVLTPTLADIYFQQGQPQMAIEIYERLLKKDPDNGRITGRIDEIKKYIEQTGWQPEVKEKKIRKQATGNVQPRSRKSAGKPKPLAGVRIKKGSSKKS
jgi:tetratricopeptide (TPR) repeat protein